MYQSSHKDAYLVTSILPEHFLEHFFFLCMYTIASAAPPMHRKITTTAAITPPAIALVDTWEDPEK